MTYCVLTIFALGLLSLPLQQRCQHSSRLCSNLSKSSFSKISTVCYVHCSFLIENNHIVGTEYVPYVFQVLAQMLDLQNKGQVPDDFRSILPLLLTPASWQQKGSIPGLVRLLKTFLARDSAQMFAAGQVGSVLAVVQQRLIPSKLNDAWGFELIQSVFLNVKT